MNARIQLKGIYYVTEIFNGGILFKKWLVTYVNKIFVT